MQPRLKLFFYAAREYRPAQWLRVGSQPFANQYYLSFPSKNVEMVPRMDPVRIFSSSDLESEVVWILSWLVLVLPLALIASRRIIKCFGRYEREYADSCLKSILD